MVEDLVQPILVVKSGTHEELVRAVATASLQAYLDSKDHPNWLPFLSGRFTKSVRRTRRDIDKIQSEIGGSLVTIGEGRALAFPPYRYKEMPKLIIEGQVSGLELERSGDWGGGGGLGIVINQDLMMSSGKTAAQVAHAVMGWYLRAAEHEQTDFVAANLALEISEQPLSKMPRQSEVEIRDAGFTEIASGSLTCAVTGFESIPLRIL